MVIHLFCLMTLLVLSSLHAFLHALADAECDDDPDQLYDSNAEGRAANLVDVSEKLNFHHGEATLAPQLVGRGGFTTPFGIRLAAAVRRLVIVSRFPLRSVVDPTTLQLPLDQVPGGGDSLVVVLTIVLHAHLHFLIDPGLQVVLEDIGSNAGCDLSHQHDEEEDSVGVDHAFVLLYGATAAKERDEEDHNANDNEENRRVGVLVAEEVEILRGLDLDVGAESDEGQTRDDEDKVEYEEDGSPEILATTIDVGTHDVCGTVYFNRSLKV